MNGEVTGGATVNATPQGGTWTTPTPRLGPHRPPLVLLADSTPLFRVNTAPLAKRLAAWIDDPAPRAAYLGASNGDEPAFFEIFESAMDRAGIPARRMIPARPSPEDRAWLDDAHLILLAGGDVARGWRAFVDSGLDEAIRRRHREGALLAGISAGAIQLGVGIWQWSEYATDTALPDLSTDGPSVASPHSRAGGDMLSTFGLSHHLVAAHDEADDWNTLRCGLRHIGGDICGYGLPHGGGLLHYPNGTLEAIGMPVLALTLEDDQVVERWISVETT